MAPHMSSKTGWSQWSDWIWNSDYQRYYRQRQDINGQYEYDWHTEETASAADARAAAQTPRDTSIDEISQNLDNTHLQGSSLTSDYVSRSGEYTLNSKSTSKSKSSKSSTSKPKSSSSKSKGKARVYQEEEEDYDEGDETEREMPPTRTSRQPANTSQSRTYVDPQTGQYYEYPTETTQPAYATSAGASASAYESTAHSRSRSSYQQQYGQSAYEEEDNDPNIAAAIAASRAQNYGTQTAGESSAASAYPNYSYEEEAAPVAPATGTSSYITGTQGTEEHLDPRYRVEPSNKFQPGEIFKVLWSEPQGNGNEGTPSLVSDRFEYRDKFGGRIFVGFRRFIVIANDQGHCTCVPIFTYGGKGCNKRGIKAEKHGIVHEKGHKAKLLPNEPKLGFPPVRMEIYQDGEKLSKESRANYSKLITVEHNVKVFFVGRVVAADWEFVSEAVNKCWEDKTHHKKKHSR